eukprot:285986-Pyramimonas_sp.AAC.1
MGGARLAAPSDYARAALESPRAAKHARSHKPSTKICCLRGPEDREGHRKKCKIRALLRMSLQGPPAT